MLEKTVRPLLQEKLEACRIVEARAEWEVKSVPEAWEPAALAQERWRAARLKRAEAELLLWLADRQWEREELELAQAQSQAPQNASPTGKI